MLSQVSLFGRTEIGEDTITMRYGVDAPPDTSKAPTGHISKGDNGVTDVDKATYAQQQGRGFYGSNEEDRANVIGVCQENLNEMIREHNQGNGAG